MLRAMSPRLVEERTLSIGRVLDTLTDMSFGTCTLVPNFICTGIEHICDGLGFDLTSPSMLSSICVSQLAGKSDW